jgi:hypothetical protein
MSAGISCVCDYALFTVCLSMSRYVCLFASNPTCSPSTTHAVDVTAYLVVLALASRLPSLSRSTPSSLIRCHSPQHHDAFLSQIPLQDGFTKGLCEGAARRRRSLPSGCHLCMLRLRRYPFRGLRWPSRVCPRSLGWHQLQGPPRDSSLCQCLLPCHLHQAHRRRQG